jgi:hypothetical protein
MTAARHPGKPDRFGEKSPENAIEEYAPPMVWLNPVVPNSQLASGKRDAAAK